MVGYIMTVWTRNHPDPCYLGCRPPHRQPPYPHTRGMVDRLDDGGCHTSQADVSETFSLNRVQFGIPGQVFTSAGISSFGVIGSEANNPRLIQFGLRLN